MKVTRKNRTRKRRGRPATGQGLQVGTRWRDETVAMIDAWASVQEDDPGRSEAIRRLLELGLKAKSPDGMVYEERPGIDRAGARKA